MGQKRTCSEGGFTLIELAVIAGIIGVLVAIAAPNMIGWRADRQLQGAGRVFYSNLQKAKFTAIREAETVSVLMDSATGDYQMFLDLDQDFSLDATDEEIIDMSLPAGVTLSSITLAGNRTQFDSRGMVAVTGDVTFQNSRGNTITVYLNSVGKLSMQ